MILFLLYLLIAGLFILDWLFFVYGIGVRPLTWMPEFISILVALAIPFKTAFSKDFGMPIKYTILVFLYLSHILIGFLLNDVSGWTILSGTRIYTKFIPIFFLPFIFPLSKQAFKRLMFFVFVLAMMQFPVVLLQRFVLYASSTSGDPMGGTLGYSASGVLAIFLLIVMSFLISFYLKKQISFPFFLITFLAAFFPLTLNETKITFFLLPVTFLLSSFLVGIKLQIILRNMLLMLLLVSSFFVLRGIYDYYSYQRFGYGIKGYFLLPGKLQSYAANRIDPLKYAIINATEDPRFFIFGRGAGNVSPGFTKKLDGKYLNLAEYYGSGGESGPKLIWEIGFLGIFLFFLFPAFVFFDAVKLSKKEDFMGAFALGMASFAVFFVLSIFYTRTIDANLFVYLFFFISGYVVRERYALSNVDAPESQPVLEN